MTADPAWLDALTGRLPRHAAALRRLVDAANNDVRIRVVLVGCSLGRGLGDERSDIDVNVSVASDAWEPFLADVDAMVRGLDDREPVLLLNHRLAELGDREHRRVLAELSNGLQLDVTVTPLSAWSGRGRSPDVVGLYDPEGWTEPLIDEPRGWTASAAGVGEWHTMAWAALSDCAKYVARASPWEALARLDDARRLVWQLWAVVIGAPMPGYGVTAVYDAEGATPPPRLEQTLATADGADIRRAALVLAGILDAIAETLQHQGTDVTTANDFATAVRRRLEEVDPR